MQRILERDFWDFLACVLARLMLEHAHCTESENVVLALSTPVCRRSI
jgi:hypothetical protein